MVNRRWLTNIRDTSINKQILDLVSPVTIDGDKNIPMPVTNFQFDFDDFIS